jgi:hypothetical protein
MYSSAPYSPRTSAYVLPLISETKFIPIKTTVKIALLCVLVLYVLDNELESKIILSRMIAGIPEFNLLIN